MANLAGESNDGVLKLDFNRRLMLQFRGSVVTSDAGLLAYRKLDDALGLTEMAIERRADTRTGKNGLRIPTRCRSAVPANPDHSFRSIPISVGVGAPLDAFLISVFSPDVKYG
jgi:hypothetical protein